MNKVERQDRGQVRSVISVISYSGLKNDSVYLLASQKINSLHKPHVAYIDFFF
jgi:hypothetical protein